MEDGRNLRVEAELFANRFIGHDPSKVDLIISAYSKTDEIKGVPVKYLHKISDIDTDLEEEFSGKLTSDEIEMLKFCVLYPRTTFAQLEKNSKWKGDISLSVSVSRNSMKKLLWGKRGQDWLLAFPSKELKEYVRNYGRVFLWMGLSEKAGQTLNSLISKRLIKLVPANYAAYAMDEKYFLKGGFFPTFITPTEKAREMYPDLLNLDKLITEDIEKLCQKKKDN